MSCRSTPPPNWIAYLQSRRRPPSDEMEFQRKEQYTLDEVRQMISHCWRIADEERTYCETRNCAGGRTSSLKIRGKVETTFAEILRPSR